MREPTDGLTPDQIAELVQDACVLLFNPPTEIEDADGTVRMFPADERGEMAEAFVEGAVGRFAHGWREDESDKVFETMRALDVDELTALAAVATRILGELGHTQAVRPVPAPGTDPRLN